MKKTIAILLICTAVVVAEGFKRHAFTLSMGIPGLIMPELGYEYSFDESNKLGASAGTFYVAPEFRLSYIRMMSCFELAGSIGYVPSFDNDDDGLADIFDELLSCGAEGTTFISATAGYRYSADCGFIFRLAGGAGHFIGGDKSFTLPFLQLGVGYGF